MPKTSDGPADSENGGGPPPVYPMTPVAVVRSCFGGKFGAPRQPGLCPSAWGTLEFLPDYDSQESVRGLDGFSHLWIVFAFHETAEEGWHPTVRPPRLGGNRRVGVFASRSAYRPNPIGLSLVKLEGVDLSDGRPRLLLGGLDLIDGTPVFDVKPYLPYAEAPPGASGGFANGEPERLPVEIEPAAEPDFSRLPPRARALIREALSLDPRPATRSGDGDRVFGAPLCGKDVRFQVRDGVCRVVGIAESRSL